VNERRPADRPYVDRPVSDREAAASVAARQARAWSLPEPVLIRHGMNVLYRAGGVVIRVGHATAPSTASHELARRLLRHGVPTVSPIDGMAVDVDGFAVTGWEAISVEDRPVDWRMIGEIVRLVHSLGPEVVPTDYPIVDPTRLPWWNFDVLLDEAADHVDDRSLAGMRSAVDRYRGWQAAVRREPVLCHGDVHPGNVLMSSSGPLLVDWDLLAFADPAWDQAMLATLASRWGGDPMVHDAFVAGYGEPAASTELVGALGALRNVAATLLRVRAAKIDLDARPEAARRLAFWRGESTDAWSAQ
jgi:hypothetical protein